MNIITSNEDKRISALTVRPYFTILSEVTDDIFVDTAGHAHAIEDSIEADNFIKDFAGVKKSDTSAPVQREHMSKAYGRGADVFEFKTRGKDPVGLTLDRRDTKRQFYNRDFSRLITLYMETSRKQFLRDMYNTWFLIPVLIDPRQEGNLPVVHYTYAVVDTEEMMVIFSTLQQFNEWNGTQNGQWSPLKMNFNELNEIREGKPVLVNPMHEQMILTLEMLKLVKEGAKKNA